ncbi:MAG TPA: Holliday junction resolvase [Treponema sp.]|nr:Holliday junction resolvase [Treponema sp.]
MLETIFSDPALFLAAAGAVLLGTLLVGMALGGIIQKLRDAAMLQRERADAVKRSRAVLGGQFGEQLAPYLPDFPCNPGDVRFVGKPVDYIAFPGTAEGRPVRDILLIEVKSGTSQLSAREKEIRSAVRNGRVRYVEYHLPDFAP